MKKSHQWDNIEFVNARCPYCGKDIESYEAQSEGDFVWCTYCRQDFELGKQK